MRKAYLMVVQVQLEQAVKRGSQMMFPVYTVTP